MLTRSVVSRTIRPALVAAASFLAACSSYQPAEYSGDGTMYKLPAGSPRYDLELEPLSLMRPGRMEFQLTTLPTDNLEAMLCLNDPSPEKLADIDHAGVRVGMTLIDHERGRTSSKQGNLLADWATTPESWASTPADFTGIWFRPERHSHYTLVVDVWVDHPVATPPVITATPHVRGGGTGTH